VKFKPAGNTKVTITPAADCAQANVSITTRNPNEKTPAQVAGDMFAYVGTMFRRLQITYRETNSMTLPGFEPEAGFMGQRKTEGGYAPGYDFAFGFIPDNMVERAKEQGWLSGDTSIVQPATRAHTSDLDIKLTLEPLPGFKELTGTVEEHWTSMIREAIAQQAKIGIPYFEKAHVHIRITTPLGTNNRKVWDTSNRAINVIINNLKGIFFDDDDFEHMSCSIEACWGKIGITEVRICDHKSMKKCDIFK
jgi:cell surface protein SprA